MSNLRGYVLLYLPFILLFGCAEDDVKTPISIVRIDDYSLYHLADAIKFTPELSDF